MKTQYSLSLRIFFTKMKLKFNKNNHLKYCNGIYINNIPFLTSADWKINRFGRNSKTKARKDLPLVND